MEYQLHTLSNGIRLIHKHDTMAVSYCGMVINTGSRDESETEQGLAHFVEHMLFKGTKNRRSGHIINRLEHVGGELNAFTSKEETVVYAGIMNEHLEKAVDLIGDIVFQSIFPAKEFEKERVIILDEIQSYNDSPSELIYDDFEEILFQHHPIGHNILGTPELLNQYTPEDAHHFVQKNYQPDEMVFFVLGNVDFKKLIRWCEKYFIPVQNNLLRQPRLTPQVGTSGRNQIERNTHQVHFMLGNRAYDQHHDDRMALYLLNNILGGPGMNSLLNLSLREKHGLVYNVESVYQPLSDTGMWTVYFGSDPENLAKCERLIMSELKKIREQEIPASALKKYKMQLMGQMALASEQKENLAISLGKSLMRYGKVDDVSVVKKHIEMVSAEQINRIANDIFDESKLTVLIYQ